MSSQIQTVLLSSFGAALTAGTRTFQLLTSPGQEIKHLVFQSMVTKADLELRFDLYHPETERETEAVIMQEEIASITAEKSEIVDKGAGTVGYHRALYLRVREPVTDDAKGLLDLLVTIHFSRMDEDSFEPHRVHSVPLPPPEGRELYQ